jgi:hypothetical protein
MHDIKTPMPDDVLLVFRCLLRPDFNGLEFGEVLAKIQSLTGLEPEITNLVLIIMKGAGLLVKTEDAKGHTVIISSAAPSLLTFADPTEREINAIYNHVDSEGGKASLSEIWKATGIDVQRIREVKARINTEKFLRMFVGIDKLPEPYADDEEISDIIDYRYALMAYNTAYWKHCGDERGSNGYGNVLVSSDDIKSLVDVPNSIVDELLSAAKITIRCPICGVDGEITAVPGEIIIKNGKFVLKALCRYCGTDLSEQ